MPQAIHRVLIVDDEPLVREATSRAMSSNSFSCDTASNGQQALQSFRKNRHDLVITDLRMPESHGHALILELLKESEPPRIVVLTGVANAKLVKDLFSRGVHDIIEKPVNFDVFATKMLSLFERDNWNPTLGKGQFIQAGNSQHPLVYQIEDALEIFSLCIPKPLIRELQDNSDLLSPPPANLIQFLKRLALQKSEGAERRQSIRIPVLTTAVAIPVDKDFVPQGDACHLTLNDLSDGGACLFNTRFFSAEFIALRWRSLVSPKRYLHAVLSINRCEPVGPFYELAGPFVMKD